jgi:hypothetical protein
MRCRRARRSAGRLAGTILPLRYYPQYMAAFIYSLRLSGVMRRPGAIATACAVGVLAPEPPRDGLPGRDGLRAGLTAESFTVVKRNAFATRRGRVCSFVVLEDVVGVRAQGVVKGNAPRQTISSDHHFIVRALGRKTRGFRGKADQLDDYRLKSAHGIPASVDPTDARRLSRPAPRERVQRPCVSILAVCDRRMGGGSEMDNKRIVLPASLQRCRGTPDEPR